MIDRQTIERIKDAADIVDVVSEFVSLKRVGANYRGLCPFHNDHSPSFYVSPHRGTCHCFVCGEGGDPVGFIMKHEQLSYPEALRWLANRYGIDIIEEQLSEEQRKEESDREGMFLANQWAADYFKDVLHNDIDGRAIGMQYFRSRGFRDDIIERFHLGFSVADRYALGRKAIEEKRSGEYLVKTGICFETQGKNGEQKLADRFAGRAIFPWIGVSGKVVAFGGRVLDARTKGVEQKYVNSPDSPIYHKDHELYGIFQAKRAIGKENCVYMVEGYTDVISMHQCGLENVVANSGTALSKHQVRLLHRFTSNIVLLYDGDAAGIKAAMRSADMLLQDGMNVKMLLLPDGDDPDSFARKHTAEDFKRYIEEHQTDFIEYKTRILLQGVTDPIKRSEAINSIIKTVSLISDPIVRATYIKDCSSRLGIAESTLISTMNDFIRNARTEQQREESRNDMPPIEDDLPPEAFEKPKETKTSGVETMLIQMVIRHGEKIIYDNIETEDGGTATLSVAQYVDYDLAEDNLSFKNPMYNQILAEAAQHCGEEGFVAEKYFIRHPDFEISSTAVKLSEDLIKLSQSHAPKISIETLREQTQHLVLDFRKEYVDERLNALRTEIGLACSDHDKMTKLLGEYQKLQAVRNAIARKLGSNVLAI